MNEEVSNLSSSPQDLAAMITVQPKAVVSRTLVNKPAGTVTLFAFDAGEGLSEHTAPYDALVHIIEGETSVQIAALEHRPRRPAHSAARQPAARIEGGHGVQDAADDDSNVIIRLIR